MKTSTDTSTRAKKETKTKRRPRLTRTERSIKKEQASKKRNIPLSVFTRIVREMAGNHRVSGEATKILHEEIEEFITSRFTEAGIVAANAHRETVLVNDMRTAERVRTLYPRAPPACT